MQHSDDGCSMVQPGEVQHDDKCSTTIGEGVTLENQLKQHVFNWSHVSSS